MRQFEALLQSSEVLTNLAVWGFVWEEIVGREILEGCRYNISTLLGIDLVSGRRECLFNASVHQQTSTLFLF